MAEVRGVDVGSVQVADAGREDDGASAETGSESEMQSRKGVLHEPVYKVGRFGGVGELGIGDDSQPSLASLETAKFNFNCDAAFFCALDVRAGDGDVLLVGLQRYLDIAPAMNKSKDDLHRRGSRRP